MRTELPEFTPRQRLQSLDNVDGDKGKEARTSVEAGRVYPGFWSAILGTRWPILVLLITLILPTYTSFYIGSMRLTVYRTFLLFAFLPCVYRVITGTQYRVLMADLLVSGSALWAATTYLLHSGLGDGSEAAGMWVLETLGAYLLGRVIVNDEKSFTGFVATTTLLVCLLLPFAVIETFFGRNMFGQPPLGIEQRLGLDRAMGPFEHPIIFGVFCGSAMSASLYSFSKSTLWLSQLFRTSVFGMAAFTSLSSGAFATVVIQALLTVWDRATQRMSRRWLVLVVLAAICWGLIDLLSNRGALIVILSYLTLSPETAYGRTIIWEWGFHHNVIYHPFIGIGLAEWVRPDWMFSTSIDNFWLVLMIRHGIPCFVLLAAAILSLLARAPQGARRIGVDHLQMGWTISLIAMIVAACTVHFWNAILVYFFFFVGSGAWMVEAGRRTPP